METKLASIGRGLAQLEVNFKRRRDEIAETQTRVNELKTRVDEMMARRELRKICGLVEDVKSFIDLEDDNFQDEKEAKYFFSKRDRKDFTEYKLYVALGRLKSVSPAFKEKVDSLHFEEGMVDKVITRLTAMELTEPVTVSAEEKKQVEFWFEYMYAYSLRVTENQCNGTLL